MKKPYIVGIDLGTSNTVVAYCAPGKKRIELFAIEQLVGPGQVAARPLLPSVRYQAADDEISAADRQLPWPTADGGPPVLTGQWALDLGGQVPGRLVSSAKSWLSHAAVDRTAPILPWGADEGIGKVSPVEASASYLAHVRAAWRHRFPQAPLEEQQLILTVPASFDDAARALTLAAAWQAGLPNLRLLEEPQAAFYDWLFRHQDTLTTDLAATRLLLVCDIGGGTTDLTLIRVAMRDGEPQLTRIGVGDHLMLGGDNMDLALAHLVESRLSAGEGRLSAARFSQLVARCRIAKEQLLNGDAPATTTLTLLGGGGRLIGGARHIELGREEVERLLIDGFFPRVPIDEPLQQRRAAIVEFGLPYPADPAISRHLAAFLERHSTVSRQALVDEGPIDSEVLPIPDTLLVNGGVFQAPLLADRLHRMLAEWRGAPLRILDNAQPDLAVARGAVAYALVRQGFGRRIGGGSARSYFLLLDNKNGPVRGVCLLPRGSEEGQDIRLPDRTFSLRLGQPVRFHLASSVADTAYRAGDIADLDEDFVHLPPVATVVQAPPGSTQREVPVELISTMTEIGTLALHCVQHDEPTRRWLLEFQLRRESGQPAGASGDFPARFADAVQAIERIFGASAQPVDGKDVRRLRSQLEQWLGKREDWDLPLLRALFDALLQRARRRRRSAEHERLWLNLAGYCLRPGLGDPVDDWRIEQLIQLLPHGLHYGNESQNWSEWWTLWRRAAGGLPTTIQEKLFVELLPWLHGERSRARGNPAIAGSHDDIIRLAVSLERLPVESKIKIGEALLARLRKPNEKTLGWWALGRLGARQTLYGSAHQTVPAEVAGQWLAAVLALDWKKVEPAAFAATQIARLTGDRARDLPEALRETVLRRLQAIGANPAWREQIRTVVELDKADERRAFGEALPTGLRLLSDQGR
ncbi:MAG: hsp70 family protein [Candidatus Accumulibacter sp.]|nr:hsp70 family protein [Accumulibacter sp.]